MSDSVEGLFKCDVCGVEMSNPPPDPKPCPHMFQCGILVMCRTTATTCEATKRMRFGGCSHVNLSQTSPSRPWNVHKWVNKIKDWVPWVLAKGPWRSSETPAAQPLPDKYDWHRARDERD